MTESVTKVINLNREEAERLTHRIELKLGTLADAYESVMPLIREAIERKAHEALDYQTVQAYVEARFAGHLTRLEANVRVGVVKELQAAGMSTRAIAPIVGVSHMTVARDLDAGVTSVTTDVEPEVETFTGDVLDPESQPEPFKIVGRDGKQYPRPDPRPEQPGPFVLDDSSGDLRRRERNRVIQQALSRAWSFQQYDAEEAAEVMEDADWTTLDHLIQNLESWRDRARAARQQTLAPVKELKR